MPEDCSSWFVGAVVVNFHPDEGQVVESVHPSNCLSDSELKDIRYLALPDSNVGVQQDLFFSFRMRADSLPLIACSPLDHDYINGYTYFKQEKNALIKRGYSQRSLVLLSRLPPIPFAGLMERILSSLAPMFFEQVPCILEKFLKITDAWPSPDAIGETLTLPLFDKTFRFKITDIAITFQKRRKLSSRLLTDMVPLIVSTPTSTTSISSPSVILPSLMEVKHVTSTTYLTSNYSTSPTIDGLNFPVSYPSSLPSSAPSTPERPSTPVRKKLGDEVKSPYAPVLKVDDPLVHSPIPISYEILSHGGGGDEEDESKQQIFTIGLYYELPLFKLFGCLSGCLWHLWELVLTGQPLLIFAPTVDIASKATLALASLVSPMGYAGDLRPFYTIYDRDHNEIQKMHDSSKGKKLPSCILGATNPFLLKTFHSWPNVLCLFGTTGKDPNGFKPTVCKEKSQLGDILTHPPNAILITRQNPLITRNHSILKQLLVPPVDTSSGSSLKVDLSGCFRFDNSNEGEIPAVHINNTTLRKHFRKLTINFLKPLEKHFTLSRDCKTDGISMGPYDEVMPLLDKFDEEEFLRSLEKLDTPDCLEGSKWRVIYKAFIRSPNFRPWFNKRKSEILAQWSEIRRILRLNTDNASLSTYHEGDEEGKIGLYLRIKKAIELHRLMMDTRKYVRSTDDEEILIKMKSHLKFIASQLKSETKSDLGIESLLKTMDLEVVKL